MRLAVHRPKDLSTSKARAAVMLPTASPDRDFAKAFDAPQPEPPQQLQRARRACRSPSWPERHHRDSDSERAERQLLSPRRRHPRASAQALTGRGGCSRLASETRLRGLGKKDNALQKHLPSLPPPILDLLLSCGLSMFQLLLLVNPSPKVPHLCLGIVTLQRECKSRPRSMTLLIRLRSKSRGAHKRWQLAPRAVAYSKARHLGREKRSAHVCRAEAEVQAGTRRNLVCPLDCAP